MILLLLLTLLSWGVFSGTVSVNISIVDQSNVVERYPNLANRVRCQNITDIYLSPLVMAADDAILPAPGFFQSRGVAGGLEDCYALTFSFSAIRTKSFSNPQSLTVLFYRSDGPSGGPGSVIYQKTVPWATNDYMWQRDYLSLPWSYEVTLQWNELGDDGVTRLNFRDPSMLQPRQRFWMAFYCTVPQQQGTGFRLNAMYWVTLNNSTNSTPGSWGREFLFRDTQNLYKYGFSNWTLGSTYEAVAGILPTTNNLAWRLFFTCLAQTSPTPAPVEIPTLPPPTTTSITPKNETNSTDAPNGTTTKQGRPYSSTGIALGVALPMTLLIIGLCVWLVVARLRKRRLVRQRQQQNIMNHPASRATVGSMGVDQYDQFHEYNLVELEDSGISSGGGGGVSSGPTMLDKVYDTTINTGTDEEITI
jgi:hypothetical protein